jgi:hypothetical protein
MRLLSGHFHEAQQKVLRGLSLSAAVSHADISRWDQEVRR